jgi:UPF0755 protein
LNKSILALVFTCALAACGGAGSGPRLRVQVPPGASFGQIADSLHARAIVGFVPAFRLYARLTHSDARVKPGTYGFRRGQSWSSILADFRSGHVLTAKIVIPEGWSTTGIAPRIAAATGTDSLSILKKLLDPTLPAHYEVPGPTLEGYLLPATYDFPLNVAVDTVVAHMVGAFRRIWTPERQKLADSLKLSEREVVTLASIIEKEAKHRDELPVISSVYQNRLRIGIPLQADPTVQYALGIHRVRLLYRDIREVENNPYNTYKIKGLPPGPIGSPSARAIDAVLRPAKTKFLYFVARPDGSHLFTGSLAEHNRAKLLARMEWQRAAKADSAK